MPRDLRGTEVARILEDYLDHHLAQGNEGDASIEQLDLEGTVLRFKFRIRHRQVTKVFGQKIVVYDVTTPINGKVDLKNPNPDDVELCVETPIGKFCLSIADLVPIIVGLVGI